MEFTDFSASTENDVSKYPSVVDRYYTRLYKLNNKGHIGEDYCVLHHSNRICVVTLAPSHPILAEKKTVTKVSFQINKRTNRLNNALSGKRKRGAQPLADNSALCIVTCSDGSEYQPCGCVKGNLVEANEYLATRPQLLTEKPETEGYIAIALTKLHEHQQVIGKLLTQEQYEEAIAKRCETSTSPASDPCPTQIAVSVDDTPALVETSPQSGRNVGNSCDDNSASSQSVDNHHAQRVVKEIEENEDEDRNINT